MKKKNAQNPQQFQAAPPKRGMRLSTIIDVFMFISGILITAMFFLPVYKDTVNYNKDFFKLSNLLDVFPDNAQSYLKLAYRFFTGDGVEQASLPVTIMIVTFMFVMPILLAVLTFPKLRKISGFAIIPIIVLVCGQFFFGAGFAIEQKSLELASLGFFYSVLIFQLPALYIIYIIQSIIEGSRLKKELKNAPNMGAPAPAFGQPASGQQFGPQGGFQPMNDQQFVPQGGFGQPMNDQQFVPQGGFAQPVNDQQFGPQGGFSQPLNDQQFGMPQEQFQQAPSFEQPHNNSFAEAPVNEIPAPAYFEQAPVNEAPAFGDTAEASQSAAETFEEVNETAGAVSEAFDNEADTTFESASDNESGNTTDNVSENVAVNASENVAENAAEFESQSPVSETSYAAPEPTPEPAPFTAPVQETQEPVRMQPAFCQHCGAKLEQGALFCMQCGAPIKA